MTIALSSVLTTRWPTINTHHVALEAAPSCKRAKHCCSEGAPPHTDSKADVVEPNRRVPINANERGSDAARSLIRVAVFPLPAMSSSASTRTSLASERRLMTPSTRVLRRQ